MNISVYKILCQQCGYIYYGYTRIKLMQHFTYILSNYKRNRTCLFNHISHTGHILNIQRVNFVDNIKDAKKMVVELIHTCDKSLNDCNSNNYDTHNNFCNVCYKYYKSQEGLKKHYSKRNHINSMKIYNEENRAKLDKHINTLKNNRILRDFTMFWTIV